MRGLSCISWGILPRYNSFPLSPTPGWDERVADSGGYSPATTLLPLPFPPRGFPPLMIIFYLFVLNSPLGYNLIEASIFELLGLGTGLERKL